MGEAVPQAARQNAGPGAATMADAELRKLLFGAVTLEMLRETFDQWTIGRVSGRLIAIRSGIFATQGPRSLIRGCVLADTVDGLAEQLGIQAQLEALPAADVEAVWRDGVTAIRP
jgi:hypothetical protein